MSLLIPIELIISIMDIVDPRTLIVMSMSCKTLRYILKRKYLKFFGNYSQQYPRVFNQPQPTFIDFENNCLIAHLRDIGIQYHVMEYRDKKPSREYFKSIQKFIKLKKVGFSEYEAQSIAREFKDIEKAVYLKNHNFADGYARMGIDLNDKQIQNLILLKKNKFMECYCFGIVKIFEDVSKLIYLKSKGFWDTYCIEIAQGFNTFRDVIILKNHNFEDKYCINIAQKITDFENVIKLKKAGFSDEYCLKGSLFFQDIKNLLKLKSAGIRDYYCIYYARFGNEQDISKMLSLKNLGHNDIEIGSILKIEKF